MVGNGTPAAGFKFNSFQEIKSHSSILYNERMAILFYLLDMRSIELNRAYSIDLMLEVRSILLQIYKNIRMLIRNNPTVRATLNLDTKEDGVYVTDVAFGLIDKMIEYCENTEYTTKKIYIIVQKLNTVESIIKDILQYFHYFIRPDFRQKPDIDMATEKYKEIADKKTVEELRAIAGKRNYIDFEGLGSSRVELLEDEESENEIEEIEEDEENEDESDINFEINNKEDDESN